MKIHLRIDSSNKQHTRFTIFEDGANCGQLCMNTPGFFNFYMIISQGLNLPEDEFIATGKAYVEAD